MNANHNERERALIAELHELAPPPAPPGLSPAARARLERTLPTINPESDRPTVDRARRFTSNFGPGVLVAACAISVAVLAGLAFSTPSTETPVEQLPVRADADAVRALDSLTVAASTIKTPVVADDQFVYVRSKVVTNEGALGEEVRLGRVHDREVWLSQSPASTDLGLIREWGQDWPINGGYVVPAGPDRPTYRWISALPADADRILTELANRQPSNSPQSVDQYTFERVGELMSEGLVPPDLAGALCQSLTKIAGVERISRTNDAIGRPGFGISRTDERTRLTTELVFRPGTPSPLGTRWYMPAASSSSRDDVLFGATAVLERGVADRLGTQPDHPRPDRA